MPLVYVVDDDKSVLDSTRRWLEISDVVVKTFSNCADTLKSLEEELPDVLVSDVKMPDEDGFSLLEKALKIVPELPVVMMTGHGDISMAVEAMRKGAYDFIEKPYEPDHLFMVISRAAEKMDLSQENIRLQNHLNYISGIEEKIIGNSSITENLRKIVMGIASFDANTLIIGETGAGKELIASCLHEYSLRSEAPFVAINCGAVLENLLESELFGHEKGAFTGAEKRRIGKLEYASEGVLFLDEIESMPMHFQIKLLRALQEKTIERVGSNTPIKINPRVICATKTDLLQLSSEGKFRSDLFYRLKVAEIRVPTLRERHSDIPILFEYFLKEAENSYNLQIRRPDEIELKILTSHNWPGNIRELKNTAHRYAIESTINGRGIDKYFLSSESVTERTDAIQAKPETPSQNMSLYDSVRKYEKEIIVDALYKEEGKIQDVLNKLNLNRRTLNMKMQQYGIKREDYLNK